MTVCPVCDKKYISEKMFEKHKTVHDVQLAHVSEVEEAESPKDDKIVLHFESKVEVTINGVKYEGAEVEAPNIETASEIVRLARDGYGSHILK